MQQHRNGFSFDFALGLVLVTCCIGLPVILGQAETLDLLTSLFGPLAPELAPPQDPASNLGYYSFTISFLGIVVFMTFFALIQWWYNQDNAYLFYAGYTFALFLYFLRELEMAFSGFDLVFSYFPNWFYFFEIVTSMFMYTMYALFVQYFLDVQRLNPKWYRRAIMGSKLMGVFVIYALFVKIIWGDEITMGISLVFRLSLAFGAFLYIIYLIFTDFKNVLVRIVLGGTFVLIVANLVGLAIEKTGTNTNFTFGQPLIYPQIGVLLDLLIFFVGLAYKERRLRREKIASERVALAARMRPHFISNGLNSVKRLIQKEDNLAAKRYLTKFTHLLREIIEFSVEDRISLAQEIAWAENYLKIEQLRFSGDFETQIIVDDTIDTNQVLIPPLVLQPHLENAIVHGFRSIDEADWKKLVVPRSKKMLRIQVIKDRAKITCKVEDNGIGRQLAEKLPISGRNNESIGIKTTAARLAQFNIEQHIIDKKDKQGNPLGTLVEIFIPFN